MALNKTGSPSKLSVIKQSAFDVDLNVLAAVLKDRTGAYMVPQDKQRKKIDFVTIGEDGKEHLNLHVFLESLITLSMGTALDMGRLAIQHPEAFKQFEKTIKDSFYGNIEKGQKILKKYGYENNLRD